MHKVWKVRKESEMTTDEKLLIENRVKSYLLNAKHHFENRDYMRALGFLEMAQVEIVALTRGKR